MVVKTAGLAMVWIRVIVPAPVTLEMIAACPIVPACPRVVVKTVELVLPQIFVIVPTRAVTPELIAAHQIVPVYPQVVVKMAEHVLPQIIAIVPTRAVTLEPIAVRHQRR